MSFGLDLGARARRRLGALGAAVAAGCIVAGVAGCGSGNEEDRPPADASPALRSVSLLAGAVDAGGSGYVDGPAAQARFDQPSGVAVADDGAIWISEINAGRVRRMDPAGRVETVVADVGALAIGKDAAGRPLRLARTGPMAAAPGGAVYVAAEQSVQGDVAPDGTPTVLDERWVVLRIGRDGSVAPVVRSSRTRIAREVRGLAVDRSGRLLVADPCIVWRATPAAGVAEAAFLHQFPGTPEIPACSSPDGFTSVTVDPQGRVVYAMVNGDVQRLESDGSVTTLARAAVPGFNCVGMAYDRRGRLLLNGSEGLLKVLDGHGLQPWAGAGEKGWFDGSAATARFDRPCGLAVDASGDAAFVVDQDAGTLRRIEADGRVSTPAGRAYQTAFVDADGLAARFSGPLSLSSGRDGGVLVADSAHGLVRQIDAAGRVQTVAGMPGGGRLSSSLSDTPALQMVLALPTQAVIAGDGSLWITDHRVLRRLGADGIVRQIAASDSVLRTLALDANGDVLVWARINSTGVPGEPQTEGLWRFPANAAPGTKPTLVPLSWPAGLPRWLAEPGGLCASDDGALYLSLGHALMRRTPDGQVSAWAGDVEQSGAADGMAAAARFKEPKGLVCEGTGVYVADRGNHTVRHVDAQRRVRTVLGRAGERGVPTGSVPGLLDAPASLARVPGGIAVSTGLGVVIARH